MAKKGGLGKGLSALVGQTMDEVQSDLPELPVVELEVSKIRRNPGQPRVAFDEGELQELSDSIKSVGLLQPIVVRPVEGGYEVVAGERRFQASRRAGLKRVPAVVRNVDDSASIELALIENIQRSDLNAIEEARAFRALLDRTGMTQEELAGRLSKSRSSLTNSLRLLDLPEEVQQMVFDGELSAGHARAVLAVKSEEGRLALARRIVQERLSVRQAEQLAPLFSAGQQDKSPRPKLPASFKKAARDLRRDLGTGVKIKQSKGKYKLEIDFSDEAELERLVGIISR